MELVIAVIHPARPALVLLRPNAVLVLQDTTPVEKALVLNVTEHAPPVPDLLVSAILAQVPLLTTFLTPKLAMPPAQWDISLTLK